MRRSWVVAPMLLAISLLTASTSSNLVPASRASEVTLALGPNSLKPEACASLDLALVVTTASGTDANELVVGSADGDTLVGGGGDDCIVAGNGDDVLVGGPGSDVCIGGDGVDTFDPSCEVQLDGPSAIPEAPNALSASATSSTSVSLAWTDSSSAEDGFKIERSPAGAGSWAQVAVVATDATTYSDSGVTAGGAYDYRVRAYNATANSAYSNVASVTTPSCLAPGTQTVYANADTYLYQAGASTNSGTATAVYIQSRTGENARTLVRFPLPAVPAGCAVSGAALRLESTYATSGRTLDVLQVAAAWAETSATWSNQPTTTGTAASTSSGLGWRSWAVTNQVKAMYLGANHGFLLRDQTESAATTQAQAFTSREGVNDPELVITFGDPPPPPAAPTALGAVAVSGTQIDLSWTDSSDVEDGFTIERSAAGAATWSVIGTNATDDTTYSDTGLTAGTAYAYRVRAHNTAGASPYSNVAEATTGSCTAPGASTVRTNRDAYVYQAFPTTNGGTAASVYVQSSGTANVRTLVGFALPSVPSGCALSGATLRLNATSAATGRTLQAYQAAAAWTETGVTWSTQPATTGAAETTGSGLGWRAWDVKSQVSAMYAGTNNGFVIRDATEGAAAAQLQAFTSREGSATLNAELVLSFAEPPSPPAAPSGLAGTATSSSRIDLTWIDGSANEDGFTIERSPAGEASWTQIATTGPSVTTYTDTGLTAATGYDYRVRAHNTAGTSVYSNVATVTTGACATNDQTVSADRDALVSQAFPTSNFGTLTFLRIRSQSANNVRSLVRFPLPAVPAGCSLSSATLRLNATVTSPGRIVLVARAAAAWTETGVTWNTQPAETSAAATTPTAPGPVDWIVTTHVETMYSGANNGFVIRDGAENAASAFAQDYSSREGDPDPQLVLTFGTPAPPVPAAPAELAASASPSGVDLTWTDEASTETGFKIERSPAGQSTWSQIATVAADATTHADNGLAANTAYDYRVRAFNGRGDSGYSNVASATTVPPAAPAAPTGLTATSTSSTQIDLTWTDNATNEDTFTVERSPGGADDWTVIGTNAADDTTYSDTGLTAGSTHDYRVRADNTGGSSAYSDTASATSHVCSVPGTQTVTAGSDVFVSQEAPTTNFQNPTYQSALYIQSRDANRNARALVHFALPAVPSGCAVTSATLRLNATSAATGRTLEAHQAAAAWTETGVTWATQPGTVGTAATTASAAGWREWTVTAHVQSMLTGDNHGFVIRDAAEGSPTAYLHAFSSREGATAPELVITFG